MDRYLYISMSGAKETLRAQTAVNGNLANANTTGFKADLHAFQSRAVVGSGYGSRAYATDGELGWNNAQGAQIATGQNLDVAVQGDGWIAVQAQDGTEAYTRAGNLHVDPNGMLLTATGEPVLSEGGPITVPPYSSIDVGSDGTVSVVAAGQQATTVASVARIKLVNPAEETLTRGDDGLFRTKDAEPAAADANVTLASGVLESSNVNIADAMVQMIELSRQFEMQVKAMHTADENARSATKLLSSG